MTQHLTTSQLAALLGCSIRTLYRWEKDGLIPVPKRVNGKVKSRMYTADEAGAIQAIVQERLEYWQAVRRIQLARTVTPIATDWDTQGESHAG